MTRTPLSRSVVNGQLAGGGGILWRPPAQLLIVVIIIFIIIISSSSIVVLIQHRNDLRRVSLRETRCRRLETSVGPCHFNV